jgi:hypothetical protein|tara:strand:+ start:555 stop:785 length:231 start_codon:yes stop_codon:yes gene_type:complete
MNRSTSTDCDLVDVIGVKEPNTIITSVGEILMYGAHVIDQPVDCAKLAEERLRHFVENAKRIEAGLIDSIRVDDNH